MRGLARKNKASHCKKGKISERIRQGKIGKVWEGLAQKVKKMQVWEGMVRPGKKAVSQLVFLFVCFCVCPCVCVSVSVHV